MNRLKCSYLLLAMALVIMIFPLSVYGCTTPQEFGMPVVLLTDYGTDSYWVPQLKGIIYRQFSGGEVIDATHDIPAFDVHTGAFILQIAAREFPEDVIFVAIVGHGSSSAGKYLVLTTMKNQIFLVPDNGLVTYVVRESGIESLYRINNDSLFERPVTELFTSQVLGRAAGLISSGHRPEEFGPEVVGPVTLDIPEASVDNGRLTGAVVSIDNFGNCVTNIPEEMLRHIEVEIGDSVIINAGISSISASFGSRYSDVPVGRVVVFINRLALVELAVNMGNFSRTYDLEIGTKIDIIIDK